MRFCANVSILFRDAPFVERFERAARAGFSAVEMWWPADENPDEVAKAVADAGLAVALTNFTAGDMSAGDRGLLSDPRRQAGFRENVPIALDLAKQTGCRTFNALVGVRLPDVPEAEQLALARENIAWAADQAVAIGGTVSIEALNTFENGPYLLTTTAASAAFIRSVDRENVAIQYDVYHMQRMEGNLVATLREHAGGIGHIQVADSPGRGEPGSGEINYRYVLAEIERLGYRGYVGLEYNPTTARTEDSFAWLPDERGDDVPVEALRL